jgi:hypothetical protein
MKLISHYQYLTFIISFRQKNTWEKYWMGFVGNLFPCHSYLLWSFLSMPQKDTTFYLYFVILSCISYKLATTKWRPLSLIKLYDGNFSQNVQNYLMHMIGCLRNHGTMILQKTCLQYVHVHVGVTLVWFNATLLPKSLTSYKESKRQRGLIGHCCKWV